MNLTPIIFSTITGNSFKLAEAASEVIAEHCGPYNISYITDEVIDMFDTFVLTYWCDKGSADPYTKALLEKMHGKKIIILGSLGADVNSPYYQQVCQNVEALVKKQNTLAGHFLCQGSIDLRRTGKKLKEGNLSLERFEKQKLSQGHPDEKDLAALKKAVKGFLA